MVSPEIKIVNDTFATWAAKRIRSDKYVGAHRRPEVISEPDEVQPSSAHVVHAVLRSAMTFGGIVVLVATMIVGACVHLPVAQARTDGQARADAALSISGPVHVVRHHVSYETATVAATGCITNVQAYAVSADGQDSTFSAVSHARGRAVSARIGFTNLSEGGTWHLSSLFVTACGSHHEVQFTPAGARFIVRH